MFFLNLSGAACKSRLNLLSFILSKFDNLHVKTEEIAVFFLNLTLHNIPVATPDYVRFGEVLTPRWKIL